jgi:hypothetical protein
MPDSRVEKWQKWLDAIQQQVIRIHWHRSIYEEVGEITRRNASLPPTDFFPFVSNTYVHSQAVAVRRLVETDARVIALGTLLSDMSRDSWRLTRSFYVSLRDAHTRDMADADFDRLAGAGAQHVPASVFDGILQALRTATEPVAVYVNRHVAHTDRDPLPALPTHRDLNVAIDAVGTAFNECSRILKAKWWSQLDPVPEYDRRAAFRVPWIPPGQG